MLLQQHLHRSISRTTSKRSAQRVCHIRNAPLVPRKSSCLRVRAAQESGVNPFATTTTTAPPPARAPVSETSTSGTGDGYGWSSHTWKWRGFNIHYKTAGCGEPILLVHGFGLSSFHYRRNIPVLAEKYKVYAIDLLGFGLSSKPIRQYSMELWRDLLVDFTAEFMEGRPVVLVGNSIGALACLMTNAALPAEAVRGTVLLNSAGAMNNKGVIGDWRILAVYPLLLFIDFLLSIPAVSAALFNSVRSKANIAQVLREGVYRNPANVDSELVEQVFAPSCDPGAREVFVSVITGPPGPKPWSLMPDVSGPLLVLWGDKDTLTPADGPVGRFLRALPGRRPETTFKMLPDVGHCLHDDKPELVHAELLPWLERVMAGQPTCPEVGGREEEKTAVPAAAEGEPEAVVPAAEPSEPAVAVVLPAVAAAVGAVAKEAAAVAMAGEAGAGAEAAPVTEAAPLETVTMVAATAKEDDVVAPAEEEEAAKEEVAAEEAAMVVAAAAVPLVAEGMAVGEDDMSVGEQGAQGPAGSDAATIEIQGAEVVVPAAVAADQ